MGVLAIILIIVLAALFVVLIGLWFANERKNKELRETFGPEYERTLREAGNEGAARKELEGRQKRIERLHLKDLDPEQQRRFSDEWRLAQAHFVDNPSSAIAEADELIIMVMDARGYPVQDFEQQAADVSVEHPNVVSNYRRAHSIVLENGNADASTEDLRQAMVHFRSLFDELVGSTAARPQGRA